MAGQENWTGIKEKDITGPTGGNVEFEGRIVTVHSYSKGRGFLRIDTNEGPRSRIVLYGEFRDPGDGLEEFVETEGQRGFW